MNIVIENGTPGLVNTTGLITCVWYRGDHLNKTFYIQVDLNVKDYLLIEAENNLIGGFRPRNFLLSETDNSNSSMLRIVAENTQEEAILAGELMVGSETRYQLIVLFGAIRSKADMIKINP